MDGNIVANTHEFAEITSSIMKGVDNIWERLKIFLSEIFRFVGRQDIAFKKSLKNSDARKK